MLQSEVAATATYYYVRLAEGTDNNGGDDHDHDHDYHYHYHRPPNNK